MVPELPDDLENLVVELERRDSFTFPFEDWVKKAMVVGDKVLAVSHNGPLNVYRVDNGRKIAHFPFDQHRIGEWATDGKSLFFNWDLDNEFEVRGEDILLAMHCPDEEYFKFIGKTLLELNEPYIRKYPLCKKAEELGITSRIVSIPLDEIRYNTVAFSLDFVTKENKRFLIHADMFGLHLRSANGYVAFSWNTDYVHEHDTGEGTEVFLKDGEFHEERDDAIRQLDKEADKRRKLPKELVLQRGGKGVEAVVSWPSMPSDMRSDNIRIIYALGSEVIQQPSQVIHQDDKLYLFFAARSSESDLTGAKILEPGTLVTYDIKLKKLQSSK